MEKRYGYAEDIGGERVGDFCQGLLQRLGELGVRKGLCGGENVLRRQRERKGLVCWMGAIGPEGDVMGVEHRGKAVWDECLDGLRP